MAIIIFLSAVFGMLWCWHKRCLPSSDYPSIRPPGHQADTGYSAGLSSPQYGDSQDRYPVTGIDSFTSSDPLSSYSDDDYWQQQNDELTNPIYSWNPINIHHSSDPAYAYEPGNIFHNTAMDPTWHDSSTDICCGTSDFDLFHDSCSFSSSFDDDSSAFGSSFSSSFDDDSSVFGSSFSSSFDDDSSVFGSSFSSSFDDDSSVSSSSFDSSDPWND